MITYYGIRLLVRSYLDVKMMNLLKLSKRFSSATTPKKIGFVGMGNMGSLMSKNLLKNGFELVVYDSNPDTLKKFQTDKVEIAKDPEELVKNVDCIITMVPTDNDVIEFYTGLKGVLKAIKPGALIINSSTIGPEATRTLNKSISAYRFDFLDAPVTGGVMGAAKGTLTFMLGGKDEVICRAKPILMAMGSKMFCCGPVGFGQVAKLVDSLIMAISMAGLSESLILAIRKGLDPNLILSVMNAGSGRSWSSEVYSPIPGTMIDVPSDKCYQPGFSSSLMLRDIRLAIKMAEECRVLVPSGQNAMSLYEEISRTTLCKLDFSVVYKFLDEKSK